MLRELGQECPLPSELLEEGLLGLAGEVSRYLQAFHGNGVLEREMPPSVHDTEAALAHDAVNAVALVDDRADQAKKRLRTLGLPWYAAPAPASMASVSPAKAPSLVAARLPCRSLEFVRVVRTGLSGNGGA